MGFADYHQNFSSSLDNVGITWEWHEFIAYNSIKNSIFVVVWTIDTNNTGSLLENETIVWENEEVIYSSEQILWRCWWWCEQHLHHHHHHGIKVFISGMYDDARHHTQRMAVVWEYLKEYECVCVCVSVSITMYVCSASIECQWKLFTFLVLLSFKCAFILVYVSTVNWTLFGLTFSLNLNYWCMLGTCHIEMYTMHNCYIIKNHHLTIIIFTSHQLHLNLNRTETLSAQTHSRTHFIHTNIYIQNHTFLRQSIRLHILCTGKST